MQTFSSHSIAMLLCILFGLMSPFLAGHWIAIQAVLQNYAWVGPVPTFQEKLSPTTLVLLAFLSWPATTLARAVITWFTLKDSAGGVSRSLWSCLSALLAGNLLHSALVSACLLGLSLSILSVDLQAMIERLAPAQMLKAEDGLPLQEGVSVSLLDADPFAIVLSEARTALLRRPALTAYESSLISDGKAQEPRSLIEQWQSAQPSVWRAFTVLCIVLLIFTETLLRFRTIMAFKPLESFPVSPMKPGGERLQRFAATSPLIDSARFALKHFGAVALHIWLLRVIICGPMSLFIVTPSLAATQFAMPAMISLIGKTPLLPWLYFAQVSGATFIAAIVMAFSTIYDAQLFVALRNGEGGNVHQP